MDTKFMDWIVADFKERPAGDQSAFLKVLKADPDRAKCFFEDHLLDLATLATVDIGLSFSYDNSADAAVMVEHFKTVFAGEMSAL